MYVAALICLLGTVTTVCGDGTAGEKSTDVDVSRATGLLKAIASKAEAKRTALNSDDDTEVESLVSPYRALRNSYVRFGRSSADGFDVDDRLTAAAAADKRSKHYVRFGRDGRHYVRFGRSSLGALQSDADDDDSDDLIAAVGSKRAGERHYVRFGRSGEAIEAGTRFKRSSALGRQYVRYGRAEIAAAQRPTRTDRQAASKHYVRFGRSGNAAMFADDGNDFSDDQPITLSEDDKRSGGKHYVRFGRSQPVVEIDDDELYGVANEESPVDKRSKHYVRFGRSGADDGIEEEKRANYVRFG